MKLGLGLGLQYKNKAVGSSGATGILDNYTGAAFAAAPDVLIYSAHSVTDNIVGSTTNGGTDAYTVTVRRNSDDALRSFNYTEVSDGTLITWVGAGNDGFVRQLWDQSGNNNHATQATAANQPKIVNAGSLVVENGKAALDFDGIDDELICPIPDFAVSSDFFQITVFAPSASAVTAQDNVSAKVGTYGINGLSYSMSGATGFINGEVRTFYGIAFIDVGRLGISLANYSWNAGQQLIEISHFSTAGAKFYSNGNEKIFDLASSINSSQNLSPAASGIAIANMSIGKADIQGFLQKSQLSITYLIDQSTNRTAIETAINNEYNIYP